MAENGAWSPAEKILVLALIFDFDQTAFLTNFCVTSEVHRRNFAVQFGLDPRVHPTLGSIFQFCLGASRTNK